MSESPHRRFDPLRGAWVIVSPHRTSRPWQGQIETITAAPLPVHDPKCYLCPGNIRANGERNAAYTSTFVFDNDFAAMHAAPEHPAAKHPAPDLFHTTPARGICRVVCFSPRHDLSLPLMEQSAVRRVVDAFIGECAALAGVPWMQYAIVFENRGAMMGTSNPHPHAQIWATDHVPDEPAREETALAAYRRQYGRCLLCDYVSQEFQAKERVVCANDAFAAVVPFWAAWPFEVLIVSRRHVAAMSALDGGERDELADILKRVTTRYDNLFETPFPYSMGFHQELRPGMAPHAHLHAHVYPPLLRSASVRKFMVGFELLGSPQRDLTPEDAAARLQAASEVHYSAVGARR